MNILITGGAGYIGSVLTEILILHGHKVQVLDNFMYKQNVFGNLIWNRNLEITKGDVRDLSLIENKLKDADIVIPLAAIVGAPACDRDPIAATAINKTAILEMFKLIGKYQQILMPTTNSAYGKGQRDGYCDEKSSLNPISLYAKDKVIVEEELMNLENATSFRLATVFGMSQRMRLDLLVNDFVRRAIQDKFIVLFEGHFKRNYIHVRDVSQAFLLAIDKPDEFRGEIFNVGLSSANLSKFDLCMEVKRQIPDFVILESELKSDPDQRNYLVSNKKIENLGFEAQYQLQDGICELIRGLPTLNMTPYSNL